MKQVDGFSFARNVNELKGLSFSSVKVTTRLFLAGVTMFFGMILIGVYTLIQIRVDAMESHKERIRDLVEVVTGVVSHYQKQEFENRIGKEEAKHYAKELLRTLRFGRDGYFFIYDHNGRAIMVAGNPEIEGSFLREQAELTRLPTKQVLIETAKNGRGGYVDYFFPRAGRTEPVAKTAYVVNIPEWSWIVGTGVYVGDINELVYSRAVRYSLLSIGVLLCGMTILFFVSRSIVMQLGGEPRLASGIMRKLAGGDLRVEVPLANGDSSSLMASLSSMKTRWLNMVNSIGGTTRTLSTHVKGLEAAYFQYTESRDEEFLKDVGRTIKRVAQNITGLERAVARIEPSAPAHQNTVNKR